MFLSTDRDMLDLASGAGSDPLGLGLEEMADHDLDLNLDMSPDLGAEEHNPEICPGSLARTASTAASVSASASVSRNRNELGQPAGLGLDPSNRITMMTSLASRMALCDAERPTEPNVKSKAKRVRDRGLSLDAATGWGVRPTIALHNAVDDAAAEGAPSSLKKSRPAELRTGTDRFRTTELAVPSAPASSVPSPVKCNGSGSDSQGGSGSANEAHSSTHLSGPAPYIMHVDAHTLTPVSAFDEMLRGFDRTERQVRAQVVAQHAHSFSASRAT